MNADCTSVAIASEVVAAAPAGVTEEGEKVHELLAGSPEQTNCTALLNPFCGVTEMAAVPALPATMVNDVGFAATVKEGAGGFTPEPYTDTEFEVLAA